MYVDTRDLYKRQCELQDEIDALQEEAADAQEAFDECEDDDIRDELADKLNDATAALEDWEDDYLYELDELNELEDEVGSEWMHGETMIPEGDFTEYAQDLAVDLGLQPENSWPFNHIDWDEAADELKQDYTEVEYGGETYLVRSN